MSKKLWCRKCQQFEMHDSSSQTEIERLKADFKTAFDEAWKRGCEIERLQKRNALLEDVAAAAEEFDKVLYGNSSKWAAVMGALDKLKKVSDE